ncbi:3-deoxy-D-manno-octulosonic acid transferase [Persicitalea jodogahamensis]|uniref:3-deoxy-D-manno-octulosonic acid transferase n=2 Tax=Persicitalea jodogahamensis TaxID=402147 RepID=A0A8J3GAA1_9BACT|nr:3-deoxy-D-manno-octulosonic acid transferase [Persicitalea jodogahamensis]
MRLAAFFHPKARQWVNGRKNLLPRLISDLPSLVQGRPIAWFHAASLGEFEQGRPVMEAFRARYPDYFIFLTFFSPSGYEVRKNYAGADFVTYLPIDTPGNARRLVGLLRPRVAFFIKYEFWYNYLRELRLSGAVILSFSAIFRPDQLFFKSYGRFYTELLRYFDHILVQNDESARLLGSIGISSVTVAGDTRFDRVRQIADAARDLPEIAAFVRNEPCLIVGSAWEADRMVITPALNNLKRPLKAIIAPHEIHETELARWEQSLAGQTLRYSAYQAAGFEINKNKAARYLLIDNIGMLSSLYRYGQVAYIGGAFGAGLHNILEAATFGLPVIFGNKNFEKFQEAVDLIRQQGAWAVGDASDFQNKLELFLSNPSVRAESGAINRAYVQTRTGATDDVMQRVAELLTTKS